MSLLIDPAERRPKGTVMRGVSAPHFVFGCPGCGTGLLAAVLGQAGRVRVHDANDPLGFPLAFRTAFSSGRLRSVRALKAWVHLLPTHRHIFVAPFDGALAPVLLDSFPGAKAVWLYQDWQQLGAMHRPAARSPGQDLAATLLTWADLHQTYFDLDLDRDPRVLLTRYADLAIDPQGAFLPVLAHLGLQVGSRDLEDHRTQPASPRRPRPPVPANLGARCASLQARLDQACQTEHKTPRPSAAPPPALGPTSALRSVLIISDEVGATGGGRSIQALCRWWTAHDCQVTIATPLASIGLELPGSVQLVDSQHRADGPRAAWAARAVRQTIAQHQPQVILTTSLPSACLARLAQPRHRIAIVDLARSWPAERTPVLAPMMRVADAVVVPCDELRHQLVAGGSPPERCHVVPRGVDCTAYGPRQGAQRAAARRELGVGRDDLVVLGVGQLAPHKAPQHFLTVASCLHELHPQLHFVLVGDGPLRSQLSQQINRAGLQDRVRLLGTRRDLPSLLGAADIYLSTSSRETMSVALIEAMASGLPCVATRAEGVSSLLNRHCGTTVDVDDVDGLSAAVQALATSKELRARLGSAAQRRAEEYFSADRYAAQLTALLLQVVTGHHGRPYRQLPPTDQRWLQRSGG